MNYSKNDLPRIQRATGLTSLTQENLNLIYTLQSPEQYHQFIEDLNKVVFIYEDAVAHGNRIADDHADEWDMVCRRVGMWSSYKSMLEPKRRGWFGKKEIPFPAKMMLSQVLSPEAPIFRTGLLDV